MDFQRALSNKNLLMREQYRFDLGFKLRAVLEDRYPLDPQDCYS